MTQGQERGRRRKRKKKRKRKRKCDDGKRKKQEEKGRMKVGGRKAGTMYTCTRYTIHDTVTFKKLKTLRS